MDYGDMLEYTSEEASYLQSKNNLFNKEYMLDRLQANEK